MKIFSWIRNKRTGKDSATKPNPDFMPYHMMHRPNSNDEDFSDWPNGLLSVGTFGNSDSVYSSTQGGLACGQDHHQKTTPEGFKKADQQFMRLMLSKQISLDSSFPGDSGKYNLSVEKFLDCLRKAEKETDDDDDDESKSNSQRNTSIVQKGSGKDIRSDKKKRGISAKSLSFLLNEVLTCRGRFVPMAPILRDSHLDAKLDSSRMEKILRAMLHKNIYPQRPIPNTTSRKYLNTPETESDEELANEEANHKSKWVKTDSEYIVLEI